MPSGLVVSDADSCVVARSDFRLGFDRPEQREFRESVREANRGLIPRAGAWLRAVYTHSSGTESVDLENVLTYNLGASCIGHVATEGLILERANHLTYDERFEPQLTHELSYCVTENRAWGFWQTSTPLYELEVKDALVLTGTTAKKAWVAGRRGKLTVAGRGDSGPLLVDVIVGPSAGSLLNLMKPLIDGFLAVGHSYAGSERERLTAMHKAVGADLGSHELDRWLDSWEAPLGPWRFLFPRGHGVQVSPADDRIVGVRLARGAESGVRFTVHAAVAL